MCKLKRLVGSACGSATFFVADQDPGRTRILIGIKKMESRIRTDRHQNDNDPQHWLYI
jgi:hypothetical protein